MWTWLQGVSFQSEKVLSHRVSIGGFVTQQSPAEFASLPAVSHFLWLLLWLFNCQQNCQQYQQTTKIRVKWCKSFRWKDPSPTARKMIINSDIETWQSFFSSTWWATQPTLARCLGIFVIFGTAYCMPASLFCLFGFAICVLVLVQNFGSWNNYSIQIVCRSEM